LTAAQPRHRFEERVTEPDLDDVGVNARLESMTDEPRRYRVHALGDVHRAPPADHHVDLGVLGQAVIGQWLEHGALMRELVDAVAMEALVDDGACKAEVVLDR